MVVLCLRRGLAFFLALTLACAARVDYTSDQSDSTSFSTSPSTSTSYSIRATTMYVVSESYTYDPTTFSTTTIYETIFPTTRTTHAFESDGPDTTSPPTALPTSPFAAASTPQQQSSAETILARSSSFLGVVSVLFIMFL
ncbi:hypothetical protein DACRYDRAFT_113570 [Dacryopinax primogenitus]|uniref:Uncharacterized protein n=1 Tax=Dacryopinax primogenitus (strain DJM 731) TaxID=1858805 RepID=M5G9I8_DACPD|nr:uncharacterized protein DACRYDRAFT_113570 [Dacryopinax primogenitus]EJU05459.1 hypothetical protein DACRYDRAFT_113570 [Dacryopinax primogenitus]